MDRTYISNTTSVNSDKLNTSNTMTSNPSLDPSRNLYIRRPRFSPSPSTFLRPPYPTSDTLESTLHHYPRHIPLTPIESLETPPPRSPPMYMTPVKVEEEVLVMDGILVNAAASGSRQRPVPEVGGLPLSAHYKTEACRTWDDIGNCRYGTKCQFAHGKEEIRPYRYPKSKQEALQFLSYPSSQQMPRSSSTIIGKQPCVNNPQNSSAPTQSISAKPSGSIPVPSSQAVDAYMDNLLFGRLNNNPSSIDAINMVDSYIDQVLYGSGNQ